MFKEGIVAPTEILSDTAKGISDLVPMQDLFNEWHAKNTSQKVRNILRNKGLSGAPLTTNPPFGYKKNPDKQKIRRGKKKKKNKNKNKNKIKKKKNKKNKKQKSNHERPKTKPNTV